MPRAIYEYASDIKEIELWIRFFRTDWSLIDPSREKIPLEKEWQSATWDILSYIKQNTAFVSAPATLPTLN